MSECQGRPSQVGTNRGRSWEGQNTNKQRTQGVRLAALFGNYNQKTKLPEHPKMRIGKANIKTTPMGEETTTS